MRWRILFFSFSFPPAFPASIPSSHQQTHHHHHHHHVQGQGRKGATGGRRLQQGALQSFRFQECLRLKDWETDQNGHQVGQGNLTTQLFDLNAHPSLPSFWVWLFLVVKGQVFRMTSDCRQISRPVGPCFCLFGLVEPPRSLGKPEIIWLLRWRRRLCSLHIWILLYYTYTMLEERTFS